MAQQNLHNAWYDHLHKLAAGLLTQRAESIAAVTKKEEWEARRKLLKDRLAKSIGGLPASSSPLNARTVDTLERPGFTVEKLYYESLPGYFVTACLFIPTKRQTPAPAVIYCSGHAAEAFRSETYQRVILNLVRKGFIVLAFDPIGQGERYQYLDSLGRPDIGGNTKEHSYPGLQCLLTGTSVARYMIHDGMRSVDYLLTRPEVDPQRLAITGRSGGGTQAAYIAAFDDRILVSAPENYITSFRRIWQSIGPQDAEQNLLSAHQYELDHADLLTVRAPKPALVLTTSRDFFSIQGARETFGEVQKIYGLYGADDKLELTEDDHTHGSTLANREALNTFLMKHLRVEGSPRESEVEYFTTRELTITPTGQVLTSLNSKTVFDLNRQEFSALKSSEKEADRNQISTKLTPVPETGLPPINPELVFTGRYIRSGYQVEKYFCEFANGHYPLPFVKVGVDTAGNRPVILYLNKSGKSVLSEQSAELSGLVQAGNTVIAPDLLNTGELGPPSFRGDSHFGDVCYNLVLGSSLVGTSLPALQTRDLLALVPVINQLCPGNGPLTIVADRESSIPALLLAAIRPALVKEVRLIGPPPSWAQLVNTKRYDPELAYTTIPGILKAFDVEDVISTIGANKVHIFPVGTTLFAAVK